MSASIAQLNNAIERHSNGAYERHEHDWYVEPEWTWAVLHATAPELFHGVVLDPACGGGTGVKWCLDHGIAAFGGDIVQRWDEAFVHDFLSDGYPVRADSVISNPPYRYMVEFAHKALTVARHHVALLVPLPFLCSQRRNVLFNTTPVSRVIILSKRPSMPPGGQGIKAAGGKEDYAWITWTHGHVGAPTCHWAMP